MSDVFAAVFRGVDGGLGVNAKRLAADQVDQDICVWRFE
jgi:hypothetical protein